MAVPIENLNSEYYIIHQTGKQDFSEFEGVFLKAVTRTKNNIRVLLGKPGLDRHDTGMIIVGQALRDAGMEIIYSGLNETPEAIVESALEEGRC